MQFLGVKKCCSANSFPTTNRNVFARKSVKPERFLAVLREHIIFSVKWAEVSKMSDDFERNCVVKCVIFFATFYWLWDFLLESLRLKKNSDDVRWNEWTNIKTLYAWNNIFFKKIPNYGNLNFYSGPNFIFGGLLQGILASAFFKFFVVG